MCGPGPLRAPVPAAAIARGGSVADHAPSGPEKKRAIPSSQSSNSDICSRRVSWCILVRPISAWYKAKGVWPGKSGWVGGADAAPAAPMREPREGADPVGARLRERVPCAISPDDAPAEEGTGTLAGTGAEPAGIPVVGTASQVPITPSTHDIPVGGAGS